MAKVQEEHVVIKVSYLVKEEGEPVITKDIRDSIEAVVAEMLGDLGKGVIIEVVDE